MIAILIIIGISAASAAGVLMWRYIEAWERIRVERAKAGGDLRAKHVESLTERVDTIEKYMKGDM